MRPWLITALLLASPLAAAAQSPARTIEDGVLDRIELFVEALDSPGALTVVVRPFDSSEADLGTGGKEGKEVRQEEARTMQAQGPQTLADTLIAAVKESGAFKGATVSAAGEALPDGALLVEGTFVKIDPGSRAKRYFAGFGAGKSAVEVAGTVSDAEGKLLARFRQRRIGAMGMAGGDSLGKLMSDTRSIGKDIGKFLAAWARGKDLDD
jgi:hypothetical protein